MDDPFIREIPLYNEPFVFYGEKTTAPGNKAALHPKDVEKLDGLWLLDSEHCFRNQVLNICSPSTKKKHIHFQSGSIETLKKMVDRYGGFTLIPEMAYTQHKTGKVVHFSEPKPIREVSIVVTRGFVKEGLINAIRKEILKIIPSHFEKNTRFIKMKWR